MADLAILLVLYALFKFGAFIRLIIRIAYCAGVVKIRNSATARALHHFAMNSTPSVPGPQWLEITPPALVSRISQNTLSSFR